MKVTVMIPLERYEPLLNKCDASLPERHILQNGVIIEDQSGRVVEILCDAEQAEKIREFARRVAPEAVPWIIASIHKRQHH